jgi:SEC-C motif-containing protein
MIEESLCPCGSGSAFSSCCQPILDDHSLATTAEMLMRSRYTAFVQQHGQHIQASWHTRTRPKTLNFDDHPVVWLGLQVHSHQDGQPGDNEGNVNFTSSYLENGQLCKLQEDSQFLKENGLWYYLQGDCKVTKEKIARNTTCPCGSGQKFKRCCLVPQKLSK